MSKRVQGQVPIHKIDYPRRFKSPIIVSFFIRIHKKAIV